MKLSTIVGLICLLHCSLVFAEHTNKNCEEFYKQLSDIKSQSIILINDVKKSMDVFNGIRKENCYIDIYPVTATIADIIIKADNEDAVPYYFDYIELNEGSAEEEISCSFDRVFGKYPERVLIEISKYSEKKRSFLVGHLSWGFMNNYYQEMKDSKLLIKEFFFTKHLKAKELTNRFSDVLNMIIKDIDYTD